MNTLASPLGVYRRDRYYYWIVYRFCIYPSRPWYSEPLETKSHHCICLQRSFAVCFFSLLLSGHHLSIQSSNCKCQPLIKKNSAAAPAIVHLYFLERQFNSQDPTLQGSFVTVCAQIQLGYSVISNSIPCLKPFMAAYESEGQKLSYRGQSSNESNNYHHENHDQSGHSKSCRDGCIHTLPMTPISSLALDSESPNHIASSKRKRQSKGKEPVSSIGPMEERGRNDSMISGGWGRREWCDYSRRLID